MLELDPGGSLPLELFCAEGKATAAPWTDTMPTAGNARETTIPRRVRAPRRSGSARPRRTLDTLGRRFGRVPMGYWATTVMVPVMNPLVAMEYGSQGARQCQVNVPVSLKYAKKDTLTPLLPSSEASIAEGNGTLNPV